MAVIASAEKGRVFFRRVTAVAVMLNAHYFSSETHIIVGV